MPIEYQIKLLWVAYILLIIIMLLVLTNNYYVQRQQKHKSALLKIIMIEAKQIIERQRLESAKLRTTSEGVAELLKALQDFNHINTQPPSPTVTNKFQ